MVRRAAASGCSALFSLAAIVPMKAQSWVNRWLVSVAAATVHEAIRSSLAQVVLDKIRGNNFAIAIHEQQVLKAGGFAKGIADGRAA